MGPNMDSVVSPVWHILAIQAMAPVESYTGEKVMEDIFEPDTGERFTRNQVKMLMMFILGPVPEDKARMAIDLTFKIYDDPNEPPQMLDRQGGSDRWPFVTRTISAEHCRKTPMMSDQGSSWTPSPWLRSRRFLKGPGCKPFCPMA